VTSAPDPTLRSLFTAQALGVARLEAARRANYAAARDAELHARLTAAQGVLSTAQAHLRGLLR
jgi:hypothetical protein